MDDVVPQGVMHEAESKVASPHLIQAIRQADGTIIGEEVGVALFVEEDGGRGFPIFWGNPGDPNDGEEGMNSVVPLLGKVFQ